MSEDKHSLINLNRDMSPEAIKERYDRANLLSITYHSKMLCEALADTFFLLKENKKLKEIIELNNVKKF